MILEAIHPNLKHSKSNEQYFKMCLELNQRKTSFYSYISTNKDASHTSY